MDCKNCIWEKTIKYVAMLPLQCKGNTRVMHLDDDFPCECFEHKDYPKDLRL